MTFKNITIRTRRLAAVIVVMLPLLYSQSVSAAVIEDVVFQALPGDRLQIEVKSDVKLDDPLSFTINNHARIAFDFQNASANIKNKHISIGVGGANSLDVVSQGGRTRLVLNLNEVLPFSTQK